MEQQNKTQKAFERIEQGVKDVYTFDNFKQYLKMLTKFHDYSLNNTILILSQKPDATLVAGYKLNDAPFLEYHSTKKEESL